MTISPHSVIIDVYLFKGSWTSLPVSFLFSLLCESMLHCFLLLNSIPLSVCIAACLSVRNSGLLPVWGGYRYS